MNPPQPSLTRYLAPLLILLLAAGLRFGALARDVRFHPDEALFATFSRAAAVQGDWLLHGSLDKTPLTIYANAVSMMLIGVRPLPDGVLTLDVRAGEFASRVPNTFASLVLVALVYRLLKPSKSSFTPLVGMLLAALSPYALAFSATGFTDGLMLLFVLLALYAAMRGKAFSAGLWLTLGFWSKQQALFVVPLLMAVLWIEPSAFSLQPSARKLSSLLRFLIPILIGVGLLFVWDAARGQDTGLWALAAANNDPGRLILPDELVPRLLAWWNYAQFLFGNGLLTGLILLAIVVYVVAIRKNRLYRFDLLLALYILAYFLLHWMVAFNIYDRYLLLILPPLWLLAARGINSPIQRLKSSKTQRNILIFAPLCLCVFALCFFAFQSAQGSLPIGGDQGAHTGIDQLGAYLDSKPLGAIIYDHWLGWELGYYLGTWSDKRKVYYPSPQALTADALLQPDPAPRYFVAPTVENIQPWLDALRDAGFKESLVYDHTPYLVYELIPPS